MAKYKQVMQVSLCGNIKRGAFDAVTVNGGDVMEIVGKHLREEGIERGKTIRDGKKKDGSAWKAGDIALYAQKRYDRQLCFECLGKEIKAEKAAEKAGGLNGAI